jgi:NADPH:quinone reductase-like Zn-dependent oxidoreductase
VINYKTNPEGGQAAKDMSLGARGADYIIEIGGPTTMAQSSIAAAIDGIIAIVGTRGGRDAGSAAAHTNLATFRRIMVGTRLQLGEVLKAILANRIKPVIDEKVFKFRELGEAYQYIDDQKHIGKVVIDII